MYALLAQLGWIVQSFSKKKERTHQENESVRHVKTIDNVLPANVWQSVWFKTNKRHINWLQSEKYNWRLTKDSLTDEATIYESEWCRHDILISEKLGSTNRLWARIQHCPKYEWKYGRYKAIYSRLHTVQVILLKFTRHTMSLQCRTH